MDAFSYRPNGLGMWNEGREMLGSMDGSFSTSDQILAMPGGSLAPPRVTEMDGPAKGPRAVTMRYGSDGSSDRVKLIVVSVVEFSREVRVKMLAVAPEP